jgi:hypothetical protein
MTMAEKKEPTISQESRPTAMDYDASIADWKVRDLMALIGAQMPHAAEQAKVTPIPENLKPEFHKPEWVKPEWFKPEKELAKPEKEFFKGEKEFIKPEKEFLKPELSKPPIQPDPADLVERVATRVVEILQQRGLLK